MAKLIDPKNLPPHSPAIPGLKPPVYELTPVDDGDPAEVDAFNEMIRKLREQGPVAHQAENEPTPSRH